MSFKHQETAARSVSDRRTDLGLGTAQDFARRGQPCEWDAQHQAHRAVQTVDFDWDAVDAKPEPAATTADELRELVLRLADYAFAPPGGRAGAKVQASAEVAGRRLAALVATLCPEYFKQAPTDTAADIARRLGLTRSGWGAALAAVKDYNGKSRSSIGRNAVSGSAAPAPENRRAASPSDIPASMKEAA